MKEIIITALITSLISAYITIKVQQVFSKRREQENLFFDVYMKLMELSSWYFWLASAQARKKEEPKDITQKVFQLKWQIAEIARKLEMKNELSQMLEILFLEKFDHHQRYKKLEEFIDKIGWKVNPKYKKVMEKISKENIRSYGEEFEKIKI
ncbi:MAG: hypothetical protein UT50_C0007G0024 [Candidatus Moranbacteria bacterium GW2011_GWA2_39_41]|nr:MAG: hypothetical protein UT50_C0007G0024 [Candidatus Moranbacteria bacterium GW2011_GWA2_39_41]